MVLFSAYCPIMLYICTKFHENIFKGFRAIEGQDFQFSKFLKGHHSVNNVGGIIVLVLCTSSALYLFKVSGN